MIKYILIVVLNIGFLQIKSCKEKAIKAEKECVKLPPKEDCICTMDYNPVCGCDKITYSNPCAAECAGITVYIKGECNKILKN